MKKVINCARYTLLYLAPMVYLMFFLFTLTKILYQGLNLHNIFDLNLDNLALILCFVFLGIASMLRIFRATIKLSNVCKYFASVMALIYILIVILNTIDKIKLSSHFGNASNPLNSYTFLQTTFLIIGFLIIIVNCFLKDKFFKTKWILAILCALCFFIGLNADLFLLIQFGAIGSVRFIINNFIQVYSFVVTVIMAFAPSKSILKDEI